MGHDTLALFSLRVGRPFAERVAASIGQTLGEHEERDFEDGEHKVRPLENVRGRDVYVIQSLAGDAGMSVNEKLCRTLFLCGALRDAAADRVTAVVPYLCYARKDRKSKPRDPLTNRYVAQMFEAIGVDRVLTVDVHNIAAYQNATRCGCEHLEARRLFIDHFAPMFGDAAVVIASPDIGGVKRAEAFRRAYEPSAGGRRRRSWTSNAAAAW
jgi:ribose-phosphate pyrophosphokinase